MSELKDKILEARNSLGESAMQMIVDDLGIDRWDEKNKKGVCPFHTKNGVSENTPSFTWMDNSFHCFGCGKNYDIVNHYQDYKGYSFKKSLKTLFDESDIKYDFGTTKIKDYNFPTPEQRLELDKVTTYLKTRGISEETIYATDIAQDYRGNVVFEYYDENDTLLTSKYRPSRQLKKGETKTWCQKGADTSHILFNMNRVRFDEPLYICEGEIEVLSLIEAGLPNAVSVPFGANNFHWIEKNYDWLEQFDSFIICSDNDDAGQKMKDEIIPRLKDYKCKILIHPSDTNDLNEILNTMGKEALKTVALCAMEVPIKDIVDLSEVQDIDLSKAEGIKSGLKEVDKRIGKFFFGTLAIWTGINGSGKSSLLNQVCVAEPTNQGYKSFLFSGELSNPQLRNWVEYPMAGEKHIDETFIADDQPIYYNVKKEAKELMREWYKGKIFLYDNEIDKSAKSILSRMEIMARKYGVKNFLIDNLMTVDISKYKGSSIFEKQKEFVLDLIKFCINHNVVIHLVAHPRKLDFIKRLTKMDVSGTGDITNLAHYVLAIHRVTQAEKDGVQDKKGDWITEPIEWDTILDLFKNRPIGFQDVEFGLYFNRKSKRFYKTKSELNKKYKWDESKEQAQEHERVSIFD